MHSKSLSLCIMNFIIFIAFTLQCEANFNEDNLLLEQLNLNYSNCVKEVSDNKIYLKEDKIFISQDNFHLILNDQGDTTSIPELFFDSAGYFFFIPPEIEYHVDIRKPCPGCGQPYFIYCKNPDCPLKKRK